MTKRLALAIAKQKEKRHEAEAAARKGSLGSGEKGKFRSPPF